MNYKKLRNNHNILKKMIYMVKQLNNQQKVHLKHTDTFYNTDVQNTSEQTR